MAVNINIPKPVIDYNDLDNKPTLVTEHSELILDDGTNPHGTTASDVGALPMPNGTTSQYIRGDGSLETFPTIPNPANFVAKADYTSHSILAKQSGGSDPVAVSIGTNEILGRKSGGGSNIEGLSVSEVKSLLNYTASDVGAPSGSGSSTGTNTGDETQSSILAKLGAGNWVDYSSISTVVGWSSITTLEIFYRQIFGDTYECYYRIVGTSNDTVATFTLPFSFIITFGFVGTCINNGATNVGRNSATAGGGIVNCTSNATGSSFTGSGTKAILGQFTFRIAP
jgi:hypothetical protein